LRRLLLLAVEPPRQRGEPVENQRGFETGSRIKPFLE
jgi:hypothetical protein